MAIVKTVNKESLRRHLQRFDCLHILCLCKIAKVQESLWKKTELTGKCRNSGGRVWGGSLWALSMVPIS